ncbi:motility associated factor glycosyltransferase family protein [Clostridium butyricum]|uniref:motility associated factor glycosyltransferase family protein n=1 Tax=Clostridium butyricum TaxID=1492 RepID=UPI002ABD8137|nr:6-hydroxymethylpterin diphosphokinase MptE-like protein [Clostridium butyricum]
MLENFLNEYSYDGYEIFRIQKEGKLLYLGSKYNMKREIEKIQNDIKETSNLISIVVFGSLNGCWLENLDEVTEGKVILIVEPNKLIFESMKNKKYNVTKNKIKLICMEDEEFYNNMLSALKTSIVKTLIFSNYDFIYKNKLNLFREDVKRVAIDNKIRENTNNYFSKIWFENYLKNISILTEVNIINNYENLYKGKPAIIISSGPSLDRNLKLLKGQEDKFIIIAVGRSLKAIEDQGIKVDFTAIIDGDKEMYNVFKQSLNSTVPMLFNEQSSSQIVEQYKGEKIFFSTREFVDSDKEILQVKPITLFQGGSVAHACIDFARVLGCGTIIFIGQDLAYTDDKTHANNSICDFENNTFNNETDLYVKGVKCDKVKTSMEFNVFRERIEMIVNLYDYIHFINATEGGAHIEGTTEKDLKDVLEEFNDKFEKYNEIEKKDVILKEVIVSNLSEVYENLDELIGACSKAKKISRDLINLYFSSNNKYNKAIDQLNNVDEKLKTSIKIKCLFETVIKAIHNELINKFSDDEINLSMTEKIKLHSQKSEFLYSELEKAFIYGKPLIKECINKLQEI